jgi:hypothetical protein
MQQNLKSGWDENGIDAAVENNHIECLKYLLECCPHDRKMIQLKKF